MLGRIGGIADGRTTLSSAIPIGAGIRRSRRDRALIAFGVVVLTLLFGAPDRAGAFIYWADSQNQTIGRADNDGSHVTDSFIATGKLPFAVAVDSSHIYWVNQNSASIGRANIDGTAVDNSFITGISEPSGIAVNGSSIFWGTISGPIGRANLDGSNKNSNFITAATEPCGLALDSGHVYWANDSLPPVYIGRAGLDGSFPQPHYVTIEVAFPCGVAVNATNIFWADMGFLGGGTKIGRANTNSGEGVDPNFIAGASAPCGIALDSSSHLYWANSETNAIGRANTDGTAVNQSFIATGGNQICGVAVDDRSSPTGPAAEPSTPAGGAPADTTPPQTKIVKGPGRKLRQGVAKFRFRSSEADSTFVCKLDRRRAKRCGSPKVYRGLRKGRHTFTVWAIDGAGNKDPTPARRRFRVS